VVLYPSIKVLSDYISKDEVQPSDLGLEEPTKLKCVLGHKRTTAFMTVHSGWTLYSGSLVNKSSMFLKSVIFAMHEYREIYRPFAVPYIRGFGWWGKTGSWGSSRVTVPIRSLPRWLNCAQFTLHSNPSHHGKERGQPFSYSILGLEHDFHLLGSLV